MRAALTLLQALRRCGLRQLVLCPGSRSGPLAVAAALLEPFGLMLTTALDERSAAFFALGLGRGDGVAAAVVTTSGTAVANLLPAAVEADYSAIPLLLLTADRPAQLKGTGANQTVNQEQFLWGSCRRLLQGDPSGLAAMEPEAIELLALSAWEAAQGKGPERPAGPVHLNLPFDEPLHLGGEALIALARELASAGQWEVGQALAGSALGRSPAEAAGLAPELPFDLDRPGVIVAGPWRGDRAGFEAFVRLLALWRRRSGWPLLADGLSWLRGLPELGAIGGYDLFLEDPAALPPVDQVLRLGPLPASRRLQRWLTATGGLQLLISEGDERPLDPLGCAQRQWGCGLVAWSDQWRDHLAEGAPASASLDQAAQWQALEAHTQCLLDRELHPAAASEPALARQLSRLVAEGVAVMLASSSPVRDWESFADPAAPPRRIHGLRGASGIDGTLSLAAGLAQSEGRLVLLTGDLALLHDTNGWLWHRQLRARLTVVLIQNGGGGIFEQLPIRPGEAAEAWLDFDRLFAMPQPVDPLDLAVAHGVPVRRLNELGELAAALAWAEPLTLALIELRTDRRRDAALRQRLRRGLPGPDRRMAPPFAPS
ncbi:2-succinyl-5-enolpyruvyl-6-hydroxy-3-cyclohexene-1-carboxylic-acid synthase [Cyanobium sp. ATX 6F1]|nr:2-succinyl-5-enolpyruvyl-6-hydroxy-3-cyclohexene-1-carboxylic-acid synthase [Cyanobium sp. ATX 6F1]